MGGAEDQGQTQIDLQATVIEATEHGGGQGHPEWDHQLIDVEKGEGAVQHDPRRSGADGPGRRREHHAVHRVAVEQRLRRQNHGLGLVQAMRVEVRRSRVDHFGNDRDAHQEGHGDRRRSGYSTPRWPAWGQDEQRQDTRGGNRQEHDGEQSRMPASGVIVQLGNRGDLQHARDHQRRGDCPAGRYRTPPARRRGPGLA